MVTMIFPAPGNLTNFVDKLSYIANLTDVGFGPILGIGLLLIVFACSFLMSKAFTQDRSFSAAMIITAVVSIFLRILGLINDFVVYICIIFLIYAVYNLIHESSQGET